MRSVIIIDTETTGIDPTKDRIIELAAVLYSVEARTVVESFSSLVRAEENEAESINRIPVAAVRRARAWPFIRDALYGLVSRSDSPACFMAHRAEFDHGFIHAAGFTDDDVPWICSKFDVEWPHMPRPGASCVEMALAHGVPVTSAHRALTDCMLIAKTMEAVQNEGLDLSFLLERAARPRVNVVALVSYDDREKAKAAGFSWDGSTKQWRGRVVREDVPSLPFKVRELAR